MTVLMNAVLMVAGACIGASLAGLWWTRENRRYIRFSEDISKLTKDSYEKEIEAYRSHISRLHRRLGLELLDDQDYVN